MSKKYYAVIELLGDLLDLIKAHRKEIQRLWVEIEALKAKSEPEKKPEPDLPNFDFVKLTQNMQSVHKFIKGFLISD